ncbi:MAG: benzoyl-CoA reductase subunit A [Proteobacteria bacterium]|nr:benzoyl-CoA reductase subunit A [Pseudomonadota bacterium]
MDRCYIGIDLGSTTTKAVFIDNQERVLGRGITNSRSNYELACQIAREEAEINARFALLGQHLEQSKHVGKHSSSLLKWLTCYYHLAQYLRQLETLRSECLGVRKHWNSPEAEAEKFTQALSYIFSEMEREVYDEFDPEKRSESDFFRDLASSAYMRLAEQVSMERGLSFGRLVGLFDGAILRTEGHSFAGDYEEYLEFARTKTIQAPCFAPFSDDITEAVAATISTTFNVVNTVGTGYGRLTLPFAKQQIRSEILCHGLGAHFMFPGTRTVLDIGGQDTKAIQVNKEGIVTAFQMNDRCAAGCGRYLGYIADEMNMGVHQLGPLAMKSSKTVRINSTCTVFAGAELRERLALGEAREDILAGLHRAIILRAMSLLARSGGVTNEFTFTGGVARNEAATTVLKKLVIENYGDMVINIGHDSIYTGAIGAALFARRDPRGVMADVEISKLKTKKKAPDKMTGAGM